MALARRDEIEAQGTVGAEGAGVGVPVEAAWAFRVAGGLELGHAWVEICVSEGRRWWLWEMFHVGLRRTEDLL